MMSGAGGSAGDMLANPTSQFIDGLPFRGPVPDLRETDPQQPIVTMDAHVKIFDLSNTDHLKEYEEIWDKIGKGKYVYSAEERVYDETIKNWRIFFRYAEYFVEMPDKPEEKKDGKTEE